MKLTIDVLKRVAKELNEVGNPDPPIKITSKSTGENLSDEIKATAEILEKGDTISEEAYNVITELEADLDAAVKVKGKKKPASKPAASKSMGKSKSVSGSKGSGLKEELEKLLKEKKWNKDQIKDKLTKKFPDKKPSTISTIISDCKSEKWTPFSKAAKVNKEGIMSL